MRHPASAALLAFVMVVIMAALAPAQVQTVHPIMGIWKLKSPPAAQPNIQLRTWEFSQRPDGLVVMTLLFINETGRPRFTQAVFKLDGSEWPIYQTDDLAEFLATKKPTPQRLSVRVKDARTIELPQRIFTVAEDGKTMIEISNGGTTVYDRVP